MRFQASLPLFWLGFTGTRREPRIVCPPLSFDIKKQRLQTSKPAEKRKRRVGVLWIFQLATCRREVGATELVRLLLLVLIHLAIFEEGQLSGTPTSRDTGGTRDTGVP